MRPLICTGFSPDGLLSYGAKFLETMDRHLPASIDLAVYTEELIELPRAEWECRDLWQCDGALDFYRRHKDLDQHRGLMACDIGTRLPVPGLREMWRYDAVKFFKQCFIPEDAARDRRDGSLMAWLDADVVAFNDVPETLLDEWIGDADLAYMGRGDYGTELGFWVVRLGFLTRHFLHDLAEIYRSDLIFAQDEYHSGFAFDLVRGWFEKSARLRTRNMTPQARYGESAWWRTGLRDYLDHLKGPKRKELGHSPERFLPIEEYERICRELAAEVDKC